ncbi:MAG TPA: NAD(P)/FAD-dependent oxidoreductase [Chloroflexota bacterium]
MRAVVVGAGLAGLTAARQLHRAGWDIMVLEASDGVGGRVRTDVVEGFRLDRGFQALFTGYPAARRQLELKALKPRSFDAGVVVVEAGRWHELGHPWKDPKALAPTLLSTIATPADKLKLLELARWIRCQPLDELARAEDLTAAEFLRAYGFTERCLDLLLGGFFRGMYLDQSLGVSSRVVLADLKALAAGRAALPRDGMQAIPEQLAGDLPSEAIRLNTPALRLVKEPLGVQTSNDAIEADAVVVATHSPEAERLSSVPLPKEARSVTCLYLHLPYPLYGHKKVVLNGYPDAFVNHAIQLSNVASSYAPPPEHLLCATILGAPDLTLEQLSHRALDDMQRWFPWRGIRGLTPLAAYQVPFGRLAQPPGFRDARPGNRTATRGLYLCGEYTEAASIEGAIGSGEKAAAAVLEDF